MTVAELLPWVNLLLVPAVVLLNRITNQLATITAVQLEHERRLEVLDKHLLKERMSA